MLLLATFSCAVLQQMAALRQPVLEPRRLRIRSLSFEAADLALDVDVTNPNPVDVTLAGFDYDLRIGGATLVKGEQASRQSFPGGGRSALEIPLTLKFSDLAAALKTLQRQDSAAYTIAFGLAFDVPVLGRTHDGNWP